MLPRAWGRWVCVASKESQRRASRAQGSLSGCQTPSRHSWYCIVLVVLVIVSSCEGPVSGPWGGGQLSPSPPRAPLATCPRAATRATTRAPRRLHSRAPRRHSPLPSLRSLASLGYIPDNQNNTTTLSKGPARSLSVPFTQRTHSNIFQVNFASQPIPLRLKMARNHLIENNRLNPRLRRIFIGERKE